MDVDVDVDQDLYSRVQYVLGAEAMQKLASTRILVVGAGGLGTEVAKNLILTGVGRLDIYDDRSITWWDLGSLFFASESSVGARRVDVVTPRLQELNTACPVTALPSVPTAEALLAYSAVVWCDGCDLLSLAQLNESTRAQGVKLIWAEARGVYGMVFTDMGPEHVVQDTTGVEPMRYVITGVAPDGTITVDDEEPLALSVGDTISLSGLEVTHSGSRDSSVLPQTTDSPMRGDEATPPPTPPAPPTATPFRTVSGEFRVTSVTPPYRFAVDGLDLAGGEYVRGGYALEVKRPTTLAFRSVREALASPEVSGDMMSDAMDLHHAFCALHQWERLQMGGGRLPEPFSEEHAAEVSRIAARIRGGAGGGGATAEPWETAARNLSLLGGASFNPVVCFIGGVAAQEALKACTGKYSPIHQFYYIDCAHVLPGGDGVAGAPPSRLDSRYASLEAVIGAQNMKAVHDLKYFMVGCGALGCELLKNFALLGVGSGRKGFLTVTDPDKIERSNLSRQFLFRSTHVGQFKSKVGKDAVKSINPAVKVMAKTVKVCGETEDVLDERFWDKQDGVITALDNVKARLYVDSKCVQHGKKMFDSGTLGSQAHSQVVIPRLSENYGAQRDPAEKNIPQCTLHFFPNTVEHTIAFARDWFGGKFEAASSTVEAFNTDPKGFELRIAALPPGARLLEINLLHSCATLGTREDCIRWAIQQFQQLFDTSIRDILRQHPLDKPDGKGGRFWSGKMKPPHPIPFDPACTEHLAFVASAARLKADLHGVSWWDQPQSPEALSEISSLATAASPELRQPAERGAMGEDELRTLEETECEAKWGELTSWVGGSGGSSLKSLTPVEFEKDDASNGHLWCITSLANLRSACYGIPTASEQEVKRISGRIIPAMITTTALITGLVSMEVLKAHYTPCPPLSAFRNAWVNLAVPLMMYSSVEPPAAKPYLTLERTTEAAVRPDPEAWRSHKCYGKRWTVWDRMELTFKGDAPLKQLFESFEEKYGVQVSQLATTTGSVIYSEFDPVLNSSTFRETGFNTPTAQLVSRMTGAPPRQCWDFVVKGKVGEDFLGPLPLLRYKVV
eukprot:TRINITY_DN6686_c0_g1_i2.p1 TRINITY_DN6686_c0_g1~~TRINITY_DN6686_c0_g1_i2.p1  ORF type:complete len:1103 (+),score=303.92 TRINITY_DN6686_c0_g1_i2:83-3310(+)